MNTSGSPSASPLVMLCALLATLLAVPAAANEEQTLYTWVDADGTVHYSDKPEDPKARPLPLYSRRTDPARVQATLEARQEARQQREAAAAASAEEAEEAAREAELRELRCKRAQDRLRTLTIARRPFRVDEDGQQIYLTDGQIAEAQAEAQQAISEWCN